jgi:hypothetical protein
VEVPVPNVLAGFRVGKIVAALAGLALVLASTPGEAQRRRRPRNIPVEGTTIEWTVFVSAHGASPSSRGAISPSAGTISIPETPYHCAFGAPNRQSLGGVNWSETRALECTVGTTVISTNAFCQISGADWGPRAAVLYLSETGATERVQITLDCAVQPPS